MIKDSSAQSSVSDDQSTFTQKIKERFQTFLRLSGTLSHASNTDIVESNSPLSIPFGGPSSITFAKLSPSIVAYEPEHIQSFTNVVADSMASIYYETQIKMGDFSNVRNSISLADNRGIPHMENQLAMQEKFFSALQNFSRIVQQNFEQARDSKIMHREKIGVINPMERVTEDLNDVDDVVNMQACRLSAFSHDDDTICTIHEQCLLGLIVFLPFLCVISPLSVVILSTAVPAIQFVLRLYRITVEEVVTLWYIFDECTDMHLCVYVLNITSWWFYGEEALLAVAFGTSFVFLTSYSTIDTDKQWLKELDCFTVKWMYLITYCSILFSEQSNVTTSYSHSSDPQLFIRVGIPAIASIFFMLIKVVTNYWKRWNACLELFSFFVSMNGICFILLYFSYEHWIVLTSTALIYGLVITFFL